jgi:hypothetical protein
MECRQENDLRSLKRLINIFEIEVNRDKLEEDL